MDFHEDFNAIAQGLLTDLDEYGGEYANLPQNEEPDQALDHAQSAYAQSTLFGIIANRDKIDQIIAAKLKGWSISRLSKQSLALLRLGVYELSFTSIPPIAVIDEAIKLADAYCDEKELSFVNGVLHAVYREAAEGDGESESESVSESEESPQSEIDAPKEQE